MAKVIAALMILFSVAPAVFATDYTVGDASGWSQLVNYDTWASGKTFVVGDKLIFTYTPNHEVDEVNKNNYDSCGTSDVILNHSGGRTTITLTKTGPMYFVCPTSGHCSQGMKLTVTVTAASTTPTTPPTTPTTTPTTPTTPSTTPPPTPPTTPTTTPTTPTTPSTTPPPTTPTTPTTTPTTPTTPSTTPPPPKSGTPYSEYPDDTPPITPDTTPPTTPTPTKPSAATSSYNMNFMVIGASVMLASVFAIFMV